MAVSRRSARRWGASREDQLPPVTVPGPVPVPAGDRPTATDLPTHPVMRPVGGARPADRRPAGSTPLTSAAPPETVARDTPRPGPAGNPSVSGTRVAVNLMSWNPRHRIVRRRVEGPR